MVDQRRRLVPLAVPGDDVSDATQRTEGQTTEECGVEVSAKCDQSVQLLTAVCM